LGLILRKKYYNFKREKPMCGIAGMIGSIKSQTIQEMLDFQDHRGPDGQDLWINEEKIGIGHVRLAIIDVEGGHQPISNETNTIFVVANGEIYNYQELYERLKQHHTFKTASDSEVILHLYEELGDKCIEQLDGMFAFALWDNSKGILLGRDPIGIKPLYYCEDNDKNFYFGSEIKSMVHLNSHIYEFPKGSYCNSDLQIKKYYQIPRFQLNNLTETQAIQKLDRLLHNVVKKRLMADVPLGCFLSGGLDSSLISAIIKKYKTEELHTFSVGLENSPDLLSARKVAQYLDVHHHEHILTPKEIFEILPEVIRQLESYDPALVRSAIPTYFVSKLASQHVKVVLSGEGADELFAGYHYLDQFKDNHKSLINEMFSMTDSLHNSNLQRADRMTMAHGLEARVPFLDTSVIKYASTLSPNLLNQDGQSKWILRKVAEKYLPSDVVWRIKEKFSIGTGIGQLMESYAESIISNAYFRQANAGISKFRSKEELLYWTYFQPFYGRNDILETMGHARSLNPGEIWEN
jgi:asparagine synthase (glutamine-hydrolysing)